MGYIEAREMEAVWAPVGSRMPRARDKAESQKWKRGSCSVAKRLGTPRSRNISGNPVAGPVQWPGCQEARLEKGEAESKGLCEPHGGVSKDS